MVVACCTKRNISQTEKKEKKSVDCIEYCLPGSFKE